MVYSCEAWYGRLHSWNSVVASALRGGRVPVAVDGLGTCHEQRRVNLGVETVMTGIDYPAAIDGNPVALLDAVGRRDQGPVDLDS